MRLNDIFFAMLFFALTVLALAGTPKLKDTSPVAPTGLLTNGMTNPQAVDVGVVLFSWIMKDADRGELQTGYQILVASSAAKIKANVGDIWNSGKIISGNSSSVSFDGKALAPATRYWWKVKLWDKDEKESPFSQAGTFDMGLGKHDWTANYIWDRTENANNFAYFRKGFSLSKPVKLAKVYVSAHNDFILYLNGSQLGFGPARSNPAVYGQYMSYDITAQIKQGDNAFAAMAHWHGVWKNSGVNAAPGFILECRIEFTDGTTMILKSDGTWKTLATTPFIESSPTYFGAAGGKNNRPAIRYDSRLEIPGWTDAGFNDTGWAKASEVDRSSYNLFAQRVAPQIEDHELAPVSIIRSGNDWVVDFGRCISGWPLLKMHHNELGTVIRVNYYQLANSVRSAGWDEYICKGGKETWRANFGRHTSFKTLRISGYKGTLAATDVRAVVAHTAADVAGNFNCSNPLLNDIFEMSERTARQNVQQGIISVDANREQSSWTADSHNIGLGLLYNHRNTLIFDKIVRDYAAEQMPDGRFWACSPAAIYDIPEWSMYWSMMLWNQYLFTADAKLLEDTYPNLSKWMNWLDSSKQSTGLIDPPGWRISDYAGGSMENEGQNISTNALYFENLKIAAKITGVLGRTTEASAYEAKAAALKNSINTHLLSDGKSYLTKVGSNQRLPLGVAWALRFGIVPPENKAAVAAWIRTQPVNIGGYGGEAFYSGTYNLGGLGDFIVADLNRYKFMLSGNRTNWESFKQPGGNNETNHAWISYPAYLFPYYISGIQPTGAAFTTFNIKPEITGLNYARAVVPTVKGDIATSWEIVSSEKFTLSCSIPANCKALVYIPVGDVSKVVISEGNKTIWKNGGFSSSVPSINYVGKDDQSIRFMVGAGSYTFKVKKGKYFKIK
ncbi:MAG: family 78 glycoside hydrolase catalytic domain [Ginsengibacter sp.]